jgi:hypothetical protein
MSVNSPADDAIVLKASYALNEARATEDVVITNSIVTGFAVGSVLDGTYRPFTEASADRDGPTGRVKIGTESNGAFRNITISNIVFDNSRGLALETVDGAQLEDITISNITMRHVSTSPIFMRLGARMRGPTGAPVGSFKRVTVSNVVAWDVDPRYAASITGIPGHDIEDVRLSNIRLYYRGGLTQEHFATQPADMVNSRVPRDSVPRAPYAVPERETAYPEPSALGILPAYGFYLRHVNGIVMDGVEVSFQREDRRPAFVLDDVRDAEFRGTRAQKAQGVPTFVLINVDGFRTRNSAPVVDMTLGKVVKREY